MKRGWKFLFCFSLLLIISFSFVSANWFTDLFKSKNSLMSPPADADCYWGPDPETKTKTGFAYNNQLLNVTYGGRNYIEDSLLCVNGRWYAAERRYPDWEGLIYYIDGYDYNSDPEGLRDKHFAREDWGIFVYNEKTINSFDWKIKYSSEKKHYIWVPREKIDCVDSDGGLNYYTKGVTKGSEKRIDSEGSIRIEYQIRSDICVKDNQIPQEGMEDGLFEYYCTEDGFVDSTDRENTYICPYGCEDGACLKEVPPPPTCLDSDGGMNYLEKGKIEGPLMSGTISEDICVGDSVRELFCNEDNYGEPFLYTCPNGCKDGACVSVIGKPCTVDAVECDLEWEEPVCGKVVSSISGFEELCEVNLYNVSQVRVSGATWKFVIGSQ